MVAYMLSCGCCGALGALITTSVLGAIGFGLVRVRVLLLGCNVFSRNVQDGFCCCWSCWCCYGVKQVGFVETQKSKLHKIYSFLYFLIELVISKLASCFSSRSIMAPR